MRRLIVSDNQPKTNLLVKRWLDRYRYYKKDVIRLSLEHEELVSLQEGVSGISYDGLNVMGSGENKADLANLMVARNASLMRVIKAKKRLNDAYLEITAAIDKIQGGDEEAVERDIIMHRYIYLDGVNQRSWEEIAYKLGYSWRHVHRLHSDALLTLTDIIGVENLRAHYSDVVMSHNVI